MSPFRAAFPASPRVVSPITPFLCPLYCLIKLITSHGCLVMYSLICLLSSTPTGTLPSLPNPQPLPQGPPRSHKSIHLLNEWKKWDHTRCDFFCFPLNTVRGLSMSEYVDLSLLKSDCVVADTARVLPHVVNHVWIIERLRCLHFVFYCWKKLRQ